MSDTAEIDAPFSPYERAVYLDAGDALVLADLHLGRAAASNVEAPIADGLDVSDRLERALRSTEPETVIVAGDLLHSFSRVPRGVEDDLSRLAAAVDRAGATLIVVCGNHDAMLDSVYDGEVVDAYGLDDGEAGKGGTIVCHGHERPDGEADRYVIGHDHPALRIGGHKRPCFLYGPGAYEGADVLVVPAFTRLAPGSTVNGMRARDFQSPLVTDADRFHPGVWDDSSEEVLWFPPLGECRRLL